MTMTFHPYGDPYSCRPYMLFTLFYLFAPAMGQADYFIHGEGKKQPFCEKILSTLNKNKPTLKTLPCVSEVVLNMPGVTDPPWEKLDLSQHEVLAKEILTLEQVGMSEFFREDKLDPEHFPKPKAIAGEFAYRKSLGAELFAFQVPGYSGDKVLVTLRYKNHTCGRPIQVRGEASSVAWATPDLKGIAEMWTASGWAQRPLLYRGRLYFSNLNGDDELQIFRFNSGGLVPDAARFDPVCTIDFSDSVNNKGQPK